MIEHLVQRATAISVHAPLVCVAKESPSQFYTEHYEDSSETNISNGHVVLSGMYEFKIDVVLDTSRLQVCWALTVAWCLLLL